MRIYTRTGDDGTTALRLGDRVRKDSAPIEANGAIDEAQAVLGLARAELERGSDLDELVVRIERDLWVVMAEVATAPEYAHRLEPERTAVSPAMVTFLEEAIDTAEAGLSLSPSFAVPGGTRVSALFDLARTVVRRAERAALVAQPTDSLVLVYLNRLSDLCWMLARALEDEHVVNERRRAGRAGVE